MITLIVLIVLIGIGVYFSTTWDFEGLGIAMILIFGIYLFFHAIAWGLVGYNHDIFVQKRNAFEMTLKNARENGNEYETAAIVKEVAAWNMKLAVDKFDNKTFILDQYVDDRIELLEPIK